MEKPRSRVPSLIAGLLIVVVAGLFLSNIFHWLNLNSALGNFWPVLVMILGIFVMSGENVTVGFGIGIFGFILLLHTLGFSSSQTGDYINTGLLLLLGLGLIALATGRKK